MPARINLEDETKNNYLKPDIERLKIAQNDAHELWRKRMLSVKDWIEYSNHQFFYQKWYNFVMYKHGWDAVRLVCKKFPGDIKQNELNEIIFRKERK